MNRNFKKKIFRIRDSQDRRLLVQVFSDIRSRVRTSFSQIATLHSFGYSPSDIRTVAMIFYNSLDIPPSGYQ